MTVVPVVPLLMVSMDGLAERLMVGWIAVMVTVCAAEVMAAKLASPLYIAVMLWVPAVSAVVE